MESALGIEPPPRAVWLRGVMAEMERIANHLGDFGAICNDASFSLMLAHCGMLRERVLRCAADCFGHRLMMDRIVPGGVAVDLTEDDAGIRALIDEIRARFPALVELYDKTASLQDRTVGTGILSAELARRFGAGGYVGRASGRDFDARRSIGYPPYDRLRFEVPVLTEGDVNARALIRVKEIDQSLSLIEQMLDELPAGAVARRVRAERAARGHGAGRGVPRRCAGVAAHRCGGTHRSLPSARCVMVPVAAAGSGDRGQHRRRLPAVQQVVQLFLLGARPVMHSYPVIARSAATKQSGQVRTPTEIAASLRSSQ